MYMHRRPASKLDQVARIADKVREDRDQVARIADKVREDRNQLSAHSDVSKASRRPEQYAQRREESRRLTSRITDGCIEREIKRVDSKEHLRFSPPPRRVEGRADANRLDRHIASSRSEEVMHLQQQIHGIESKFNTVSTSMPDIEEMKRMLASLAESCNACQKGLEKVKADVDEVKYAQSQLKKAQHGRLASPRMGSAAPRCSSDSPRRDETLEDDFQGSVWQEVQSLNRRTSNHWEHYDAMFAQLHQDAAAAKNDLAQANKKLASQNAAIVHMLALSENDGKPSWLSQYIAGDDEENCNAQELDAFNLTMRLKNMRKYDRRSQGTVSNCSSTRTRESTLTRCSNRSTSELTINEKLNAGKSWLSSPKRESNTRCRRQ